MSRFAHPRMVLRSGRRGLAVTAALVLLRGRRLRLEQISLRSVPKSPLVGRTRSWPLTAGQSPAPGRSNCCGSTTSSDDLSGDIRPAVEKTPGDQRPRAVGRHRLCHVGAGLPRRQEDRASRQAGVALDLYGASVLHAYDYLFDPALCRRRAIPTIRTIAAPATCTTARWRRRCGSSAPTKELVPDTTKTINTASGAWDITLRAPRQPLAAERLRALRVRLRLRSQRAEESLPHARPGRAADRRADTATRASRWPRSTIPPGLSFPVTAFLRPLSKIDPSTGQVAAHNQCVLELYDPLTTDETLVAGQRCRWKAI